MRPAAAAALAAVGAACATLPLPPGRICATAHEARALDTDCACYVAVREGEAIDWRVRACPPSPAPEPTPSAGPAASPPPSPSPSPSASPSASPAAAPTPRPAATPATCPPVACFGVEVLQFMDAGFHTLPVQRQGDVYVGGQVGGYVVLDSTPDFGRCGPRFRCNSELNEACGGRACEDPRGPRWRPVAGPAMPEACAQNPGDCRPGVLARGYQLRARLPRAGTYTWEVCSAGFVDGEGVAVPGDGCGRVTFRAR